MEYPPSPALSTCDSLSGIDDLDAYLISKGALSHFPTPPLKKTPFVTTVGIAPDAIGEVPDTRIATLMAEQASVDIECTPDDIVLIEHMVLRSKLPLTIISLAFNVLAALHTRSVGSGHFSDTPPDLLVLASFSLAVSYTDDHPPRTSWWSSHVCHSAWTVDRIDKTILRLFAALGFKLYEYSTYDSVMTTKSTLLGSAEAEAEAIFFDVQSTIDYPRPSEEDKTVRFQIDPATATAAYWDNGQLTPDDTPPPHLANPKSLGLGLCMPLRRFSPLL